MARRATYIQQARAQTKGLLLLDAGDAVLTTDQTAREHSALILRAMQTMGYDALNLGEQELLASDQLKGWASAGYSLLSANVHYPAGEGPQIDPYLVKEVGSRRVAIVGVLGAEIARGVLHSGGASAPSVGDEVAALQTLVPRLRAEADVVVVLAHLGWKQAGVLAERVPGIDIVIVGHGGNMSPTPMRVGQARLVQAGRGGENVGDLTLTVSSDGKIVAVEGKAVPLGLEVPDDPQMKALMDTFRSGGWPAIETMR